MISSQISNHESCPGLYIILFGKWRVYIEDNSKPYYRFLCYSKILEIPFKDGKKKGNWIDKEIPNLKGGLAISFRDRRVNVLGGKTLGKWLKEDGRDALSHANVQKEKIVRDPNSYQDWDDIKWGNIVMHELAEKVIVAKLGVPPRGN